MMGKRIAHLHCTQSRGPARCDPVQPLFLQSVKGHAWHQMAVPGRERVGLESGLEEEDVLVNPTVVGAAGVSRWEDLGNFQTWVREVKAGGGPGSRHGVRSFYVNKT